jgi:YbbR domain-containing protein
VADVKEGLGVKVIVDAEGLAAGSHSVELKTVLPERVKLLSLSPEKVKIKLWEQKK